MVFLRLFNCVTAYAIFQIPKTLEIGLVLPSAGGPFPGLFLFTTAERMMRPVRHLATGKIELIGSFEQVFMDIAVRPEEVIPEVSTHIEIDPINMLSVVANLTPLSDFNQSPRNMYQCQMAKQTMGTPTQSWQSRSDSKLYRLHNVQTPLVRPEMHSNYALDNYPNGANAIVAVLSYTSYDMEDAMIINKSSHDRGFGHASIYKLVTVDLKDSKDTENCVFGILDRRGVQGKLDKDGLPFVLILHVHRTVGLTQLFV